mgnify:CR=1 FL=1
MAENKRPEHYDEPDLLSAEAIGLRPVMSLTTEIIGVQDIAAGEPVGYGGSFVAETAMRSAWWPAAMRTAIRASAPRVRPCWWTVCAPAPWAASAWT